MPYRRPRESDSPIGLVLPLAIIVGGLYAWKEGWFDELLKVYKEKTQEAIDNFKENAPDIDLTPPSLRGNTGGGGGLVYRGTGKVMGAKQEGPKTRHYASGKPNDTTTEWNVDNCPFSAYEFDADVIINKIDHDDEVSMKMFGPQHQDGKGAWYINNITFNSGTVKGGWEQPHPETTSGCVKGPSIGNIKGKSNHYKSIIWPLSGGGAHIEFHVNGQRVLNGNNWCGKRFKRDSNQQVQLRIDAAPGVKASNVKVSEIVPPSTAGAAFTFNESIDMNQVRVFQNGLS